MNTSSIEIIKLGSTYHAYYSAAWKTGREAVKDERGEPVRYPTEEKAKVGAYEALLERENKTYALRYDPCQVKATPTVWETIRNPKSRAGKRLLAEAVFKVREAAE